MASAPLIGFPSVRRQTSYAATSAAAGYPASQLGVLPVSAPWRSTGLDPADCIVTGTYPSSPVWLMVAGPHLFSVVAKHRLSLYFDEIDGILVYDSGWIDVWPAVFTEEQVDWDGGRWWDRTYTNAEIRGYPWWLSLDIPAEVGYSSAFKWEFDDAGGDTPFVQIGLIEPSGKMELPVMAEVGAQYGYRGRSEIIEADGGTEYVRRRNKPRVFSGAIPYIDREYALASFLELRRINDQNVPFFWWPDPDDTLHTVRNAFLARFDVATDLQSYATALCYDGVPMNFKEVI